MLFFGRRDASTQSNLTDQERCIHACLFFSFLLFSLTIVFFYFGATSNGTSTQRLNYYLGASISLILLLLIVLCSLVSIRRFYGFSASSSGHQEIAVESEHHSSKYSNNYG